MMHKKHYNAPVGQVLALLLTLTALLVVAASQTLAWQGLIGHKSNEAIGAGEYYTGAVQLNKYERDLDGNETTVLIEHAEFYLYQVTEGGDIQIGDRYVSDSQGKIIVQELKPGDYYFLETAPAYGYTWDKDSDADVTKYYFIATGPSGSETIVVNAYNRRLAGSLTITKEVVISEAEEVPEEMKEIVDTEPTAEETTDIREVTEETADTGSEDDAGAAGSITSMEAAETPPAAAETSDSVNGIIDLADTDLLEQTFEFIVTFSDSGTYEYRIDGGTPQQLISGGTLMLKSGQSAVFSDLPVGVLYTVTEKPVDGYLISSEGEHQGNIIADGNTVRFINTLDTAEPGDTEIAVTKVVKGSPPDTEQDQEFAFTITIDGVSQEFVLRAGETKTFTVPVGVIYEVREKDSLSDGYSQAIANGYGTVSGQTIQVTATNTWTGSEWIDIPVEKSWDFINLPKEMTASDQLPGSITVSLRDGDRTVETATVYPDTDGNWKYTFSAPRYRADGVTEIEYSIAEEPVSGFVGEVDGWQITNTYVTPITFDAPMVEKQIAGDAPEADAQFWFVLSAQGGAPMPKDAEGDSTAVSLTGAGEMKFGTITYTDPGTYTYTLAETTGSDSGYEYDKSIYTLTVVVEQQDNQLVVAKTEYVKNSGSQISDSAVFVNTYRAADEPEDTVTISGEKSWKHGNNTNVPDSATLYIMADGQRKISFKVDESSHWNYSYTLPKYNEEGKEIVYTIEEEPVPGYSPTIHGFNITNTHDSVLGPGTGGTPSGGNGGQDSTSGRGVKTGDTTNIWIWIVVIAVSAGVLVKLIKKLKMK